MRLRSRRQRPPSSDGSRPSGRLARSSESLRAFRGSYRKVLAFAAVPFLIFGPWALAHSDYAFLNRALGLVGLYVLLALGLNFTLGYVGLFDLGYAAFYAIGAYTAAILSIHNVSFEGCLAAAVAVSLLSRLVAGIPILRLRGDYLAIVTMGFGEITRLALNNMDFITNGPKGLPRVGQSIQPIQLLGFPFTDNMHFVYLILAMIVFFVGFSVLLENSRIGRAWIAIREDEVAAELSGVPVLQMKLLAFVLSAVPAGMAGAVFAHWERFVTPESFVFWESILVFSMVVVGGIGSIPGVILGAILLGGTPQILQATLVGSGLINYRYLFFGMLLVLTVLFKPEGLWPSRRHEAELKQEQEP